MFKHYRLFPIFFDAPGGTGAGAPAGGGNPGGSPSPSPSPSPAPSPAPAAAPAPAPGGTGAPMGAPGGTGAPGTPGAPPTPTRFSYDEDRSRWIPPHRLEEQQGRFRSLEQQHRLLEQRVRVMMGLEPQAAPRSPEHEAIRSTLIQQIVPELAPLLQHPDALAQVLELARSGRLQEMGSSGDAYWQRHALTTARDAAGKFATAAGITADKLPQNFERRVARELMAYIQSDRTGQLYQRYEQGDPTLVDEFVNELKGAWLTPFQVQANNDTARNHDQNRNLPRRGVSGGVPPNAGNNGNPPKRSREEIRRGAREFVRQNMG